MAKNKDESLEKVSKRIKKLRKKSSDTWRQFKVVEDNYTEITEDINDNIKNHEEMIDALDALILYSRQIIKILKKTGGKGGKLWDFTKSFLRRARHLKEMLESDRKVIVSAAQDLKDALGAVTEVESREERLGKLAKKMFGEAKEAEEE